MDYIKPEVEIIDFKNEAILGGETAITSGGDSDENI